MGEDRAGHKDGWPLTGMASKPSQLSKAPDAGMCAQPAAREAHNKRQLQRTSGHGLLRAEGGMERVLSDALLFSVGVP